MVLASTKAKRKATGDPGLNEFALNTNRTVEHIVELQGREGSRKYQQMAKGDPQVGMILRVHKNPIRSACWGIAVPDDASDKEKMAIELINKWFFEDYTLTFDTLLGQILSFLEYGFSCFERIWKPFNFNNTMFLVPTLQQRMQTSIENIFPHENKIQQITITKGLVEIPLDDMVFFILNQQGQDMRGESLLRNAYVSWKHKSVYNQQLGIGIQRTMSGVPSLKVPKGTKVDGADYTAAVQLLENIVFHENAYMIYPDGWEFAITDSNFNADQVQKAIDAKDREMALSVLAQFVLLGQAGKGGAYALSRDQSDFFLDGLQYIVTLVENIFHRQVITPFIKLNFGDTVDPGRVQLRGLNLNKKAGEELSKILGAITSQGYMHPTVDDEIQLRKGLEMPPLSEDEVKALRERAKKKLEAPTPTPPAPNKANPRKEDDDDDGSVDPDDKNLNNALKFAEIRISSRRAMLDSLNKEVTDFMQANLLLIKDKLMADIEKTLRRGTTEIQGLKGIDVPFGKYVKGLERKLAGIANDGWNFAKKSAKTNKVKLADIDPKSLPDKELKQFVLNESDSVADAHVSAMKNKAILTASNGPIKGFSINQTMSNVEKVVDKFIKSNVIGVGGGLVVVGSSNFGSNQFNKEIEDQLWGYAFVAVDDGATTDICRFYNGKTFSVNGTELSVVTPPLHPNCRSFLEPIYKAVTKKPEIDDTIAPPSIQKQKTIF